MGRENREEKIQDWLKVVRSFSAGGYECAVDRDGDGDSNTNDKSRGKGKNTRSYIMVGPGNSREYQHPVRIEADKNSAIGGYLVTGLTVEADIQDGNWLLVRVHRRNIIRTNTAN